MEGHNDFHHQAFVVFTAVPALYRKIVINFRDMVGYGPPGKKIIDTCFGTYSIDRGCMSDFQSTPTHLVVYLFSVSSHGSL